MNNDQESAAESDRREQAIFTLAASKSGADRAAFLDRECVGNDALRQRLEALLSAHEQPDSVLDGAVTLGTLKVDFAVAVEDQAVGQTIGRYKLLERVGEGGCGVVYVAEQNEPVRRRVALKVIKLGMDTKAVVARFEAERQALAMMDHPNIAKVFEAGATETGRPYFVMELVRGIRITDYCDQNHLTTKDRLDLFTKVCHAIQHAHQKGIIHRDIKPSNILVTLHDGVPVPKVIDFGIAKATEGRLSAGTVYTQLHQFIGTPAYMSPEQAEMSGLNIDTRSDIYSLGVLLYQLLTGQTPFDAKELAKDGLDAIRRTIREVEPLRPSTRLSTLMGEALTATAKRHGTQSLQLLSLIRGDLDWIVMKCLEKDRTRRYETANGLALDIRRHLENEPVLARPPSTAYRLQKMVRRNRLAFAAASAVALALAAGLGLSTWSFLRERKAHQAELFERKSAEEQRQLAEASAQTAREQRKRAEAGEAEARGLLYAAEINLAQQAWDQNNLGRLRQLLAETRSFRDRGFEWNYWQRQAHLDSLTLLGHLDAVTAVAFSPDGQRVVTGSSDQTAKVWDAASGRELLALKGHASGLWCVAFSPDGRRIATGSDDKTAKVWDAATGAELFTIDGHGGEIGSLAFSPDGQRIATAGGSKTAKVWDAVSGKPLLSLPVNANGFIWCVAFSPDGRRIATGSWDQTARIWDASDGREELVIDGQAGAVFSVDFSPDSRRIVTAGTQGLARVWDAASGKQLAELRGHSDPIHCAVFSPDGQRIVTCSDDRTARVWDAVSGRELLPLKGHSGRLYSVAFSPDGRRIVTAGEDQVARIWEPDGDFCPDGTAGRQRMIERNNDYFLSLAFCPIAQRFATASDHATARVWPLSGTSQPVTLTGHTQAVCSIVFSSDGQRVITGSADNTAKMWEAATGRELLTLRGHTNEIWSVAFSPDGQRIATGSDDATVRLWDAATGRERATLRGHTAEVKSVAFSPDGTRLASGGHDKTIRLWDVLTGRELFTFRAHEQGLGVTSVAFSPDGKRILSGGFDKTARVWDAATGRELITLQGNTSVVWVATFSADGQRILTGCTDGTAKLWEAATGREVLTFKGHNDVVRAVAFSSDGEHVFTGGSDRIVRIWDAASSAQITAWQQEDRREPQALKH